MEPARPDGARMGRAGVFARSFTVDRPTRAPEGRPFPIEIDFDAARWPGLRAWIHADLGGRWETLQLRPAGPGRLRHEGAALARGRYRFRVLYAIEEGPDAPRYLDPAPYAEVIVEPALVADLRLYSLVPTATGTIARWREWLPHVRDLGFNAVHLLPLTAMDRSGSPYATGDLFAIDPRYGDADDPRPLEQQLDGFVEACRAHGLRLCVDLVLNHVGVGSLLAREHPEWIVPDPESEDGMRRAGWHDGTRWHGWPDVVLLYHDHPCADVRGALWRAMRDYALRWAGLVARAGGLVRLDNLHSSHAPLVAWLLDSLREPYPGLVVLAELFADTPRKVEICRALGVDLLVATPWEHPFVPELRRYVAELHAQHGEMRPFMPVNTHDTGSPAQQFGDARATLPRYAAAALLGTGATGMAQGVEFGLAERLDPLGRRPPIGPPPAAAPRDRDFRADIARLNRLHREHAAFRSAGNLRFVDREHPAILAAWRRDPGGEGGFLVACNFDIRDAQRVEVAVEDLLADPADATVADAWTQEAGPPGARIDLSLPPCGVRVLRVESRARQGRAAEVLS